MSLLLIGGIDSSTWAPVADAVIERSLEVGDQVRLLLSDRRDGRLEERLRVQGVHLAFGDASNGDLLERAAQGCRTVVLFEPDEELLPKAIEAVRFARVERLILCEQGRGEPIQVPVPSYVVLRARLKGRLRPGSTPDSVASAIDAADDLAGEPKLDLDLADPAAWGLLGLPPP